MYRKIAATSAQLGMSSLRAVVTVAPDNTGMGGAVERKDTQQVRDEEPKIVRLSARTERMTAVLRRGL